ncbi:MAG TPA: hypothetical protein VFL98_02240 [Candidatus Paceibacterota bacterium]|nr:hypothetical protein [Candidatus Paceibacterota bacterium]
MRSSSIIGIIVAILIIAGLIWYFTAHPDANMPAAGGQPASVQDGTIGTTTTPGAGQQQAATATPAAPAAQTVTITYNGSSFSPSTVTINAGDTVTFVDASGDPMWVATGVHPTHTVYDGTDRAEHCAAGYTGPTPFDECKAATSNYSFTFTKAGTWPFHNHVNPSATGQVIVR